MRKEGLIDKQPPGKIEGFFGKISTMIQNDEQRKLVGRMLDEKAENRFDLKTVQYDERTSIEGMNENSFIDLI